MAIRFSEFFMPNLMEMLLYEACITLIHQRQRAVWYQGTPSSYWLIVDSINQGERAWWCCHSQKTTPVMVKYNQQTLRRLIPQRTVIKRTDLLIAATVISKW